MTSTWGMTVRPTVTPAIRSETAMSTLQLGSQEMMGTFFLICLRTLLSLPELGLLSPTKGMSILVSLRLPAFSPLVSLSSPVMRHLKSSHFICSIQRTLDVNLHLMVVKLSSLSLINKEVDMLHLQPRTQPAHPQQNILQELLLTFTCNLQIFYSQNLCLFDYVLSATLLYILF